MLTETQYFELKSRNDAYEKWRNGRTCVKTDEIPVILNVTNDERSALEVYEFCQNPPERYFLYIKLNPNGYTGYGSSHMATTWTGEYLGDVQFGRTFKSSFGDTRVSITVAAINGRKYHGTYYKSAGDYARVKLSKR